MRTPNPKSKRPKHVTTERPASPQVHAQVAADTKHKPGQYPPIGFNFTHSLSIVQRLSPVQIDVDLESDVGSLQASDADGKNLDGNSQLRGDDAQAKGTFSDSEGLSDQEQDNIQYLEPSAVRTRFENEVCNYASDHV